MAATIPELLAAAARRDPAHVAIVDGDRHLDYAQLDALADRIANALVAHGVDRGDRVGVHLDKSIEAVAALYGVMRAGAAYVPLDPHAPVTRLAKIARDAGLKVVVSENSKCDAWPVLAAATGIALTVLVGGDPPVLDAASRNVCVASWAVTHASGESPPTPPGADDLAYILYTSGSTGDPKGVIHSHASGLAFVEWATTEIGVTADDRLSSHAPLHFDLSTFDLYASACAGATLVLVPAEASVFPAELAKFVERERISIWYSVPSILTMLVLRGKLDRRVLDALRVVIFAGEVFPPKHLAALQALLPGRRFVNFYGPTETNVCTWYDVPVLGDEPPEAIPIGRVLPCVSGAVVDEGTRPVDPGGVGELLITGPTVMHGYWADPERSARGLVAGFGGSSERTYRTGDLVRDRGDGNYEFLGRRDAQIKSRGYRIELGEIESALHTIDRVVEAAAVAIPDDVVTNRIVAFVVGRDELTARAVVAVCRDRLPSYMVPEEIFMRAELPKSSTGKIDRRQLAASMGAPE